MPRSSRSLSLLRERTLPRDPRYLVYDHASPLDRPPFRRPIHPLAPFAWILLFAAALIAQNAIHAAASGSMDWYPVLSNQIGQDTVQTACSPQQAWDIAELFCRVCSTNQSVVAQLAPPYVASSTSDARAAAKRQCQCMPGYVLTGGASVLDSRSSCKACNATQTSSFERSFCLFCERPFVDGNGATTCLCDPGQYLMTRDAQGIPLTKALCKNCPKASYPSDDLSTCISCPDANMIPNYSSDTGYECLCNTTIGFSAQPVGNQCVNSTSLLSQSSQNTVDYPNAVGPSGLSAPIRNFPSDFFSEYLAYASNLCSSEWDEEACSLLANLCVLQMYNQKSAACKSYLDLALVRSPSKNSPIFERPVSLPWLFYKEQALSISAISPNLTVDLSKNSGQLSFVLATYNTDGTFAGFQALISQFDFCENGATLTSAFWREVGYNYVSKCSLSLRDITNTTTSTLFYDPYLLDDSGNLFPVPIRVHNLAENSDMGLDYTGNVFTRRFFLIDNISGVSNGTLQVIRFPTYIGLTIRKVDTAAGAIYSPILSILYAERSIQGTIAATDNSQYAMPKYTFQVTYNMSLVDFWRTMQILFALTTSLALVFGLYLARNWSRRSVASAAEAIDLYFLGQALIFMTGCLGSTFFWLLFSICCYWLIFYKAQTTLFLVLPINDMDLYNFNAVLITAIVTQTFFVVVKLWQQSQVDLFFFDWEKGKGVVASSAEDDSVKVVPVSIWRTIFMANQWNSLQCYRKVSMEFLLVWTYFFLDGLNIKYAATPQPNIRNLSPGARSPVLVFAIDALILLFFVAIQYTFRFLVYDRFYRDRLLQYMDLLSTANVSLIIFDEKCHGYYIHGRSVHPMADTDINELNENLRKEENDMVPARGLMDTDQQAFEIFVTASLRSTYDKIYSIVVGENSQIDPKLSGRLKHLSTLKASGRPKSASEKSVKAYQTINKFLCTFFDRNIKEYPYAIRDKSYFEKFLGAVPEVTQGSVFLNDTYGFSRVLMRGLEPALLTCYALIFIGVDISTGSVSAAAVVVYLLDLALCFLRRHVGERNIADKTILDWKFLV
ncbi:transmembrane protein 67-domain-containing protein [Zopfochytrium polystomum]|nr:transmembrane protein 67-domain-containing protein [Zopfochytrium polystomum]